MNQTLDAFPVPLHLKKRATKNPVGNKTPNASHMKRPCTCVIAANPLVQPIVSVSDGSPLITHKSSRYSSLYNIVHYLLVVIMHNTSLTHSANVIPANMYMTSFGAAAITWSYLLSGYSLPYIKSIKWSNILNQNYNLCHITSPWVIVDINNQYFFLRPFLHLKQWH